MPSARLPAVLSLAAALFLSACAFAPAGDASREAVAALAPTGKLRVGVYSGSPTSFIPADGTKPARGVAYELGAALAQDAGVPFEPVIFPSNDKMLEAFRAGSLDLVLTNATATRAQFIDFTPTVFEIEKGYLVRAGSPLEDAADIDRTGIRVGVSRGSSSAMELAGILKNAQLVQVASLDEAGRALADGRIDAFGTNKAILFQLSDGLPGSRVIGNWGGEAIALGVPRNRPAALAYVTRFAQAARERGVIAAAAARAGLRGLKP